MIRDATGINEAMDGTTPKGDALVGVREQAIAAGNNAIYDITHAAQVLSTRRCVMISFAVCRLFQRRAFYTASTPMPLEKRTWLFYPLLKT